MEVLYGEGPQIWPSAVQAIVSAIVLEALYSASTGLQQHEGATTCSPLLRRTKLRVVVRRRLNVVVEVAVQLIHRLIFYVGQVGLRFEERERNWLWAAKRSGGLVVLVQVVGQENSVDLLLGAVQEST